jgi:hypothetical protein
MGNEIPRKSKRKERSIMARDRRRITRLVGPSPSQRNDQITTTTFTSQESFNLSTKAETENVSSGGHRSETDQINPQGH